MMSGIKMIEKISEIKPSVGECLIYKPYRFVTYKEVTKNTKYQILIVL